MVLEFGATRDAHLQAVSRQMGANFGHPYVPRTEAASTAWQLAIAWVEEYARTHPEWVHELEGVLKKPITAWIVGKMGVRGPERILASVFVGLLLDRVFQWVVDRELGRGTGAHDMFNGSIVDLLGRWVASFVHQLPVRETWP